MYPSTRLTNIFGIYFTHGSLVCQSLFTKKNHKDRMDGSGALNQQQSSQFLNDSVYAKHTFKI